MSDLLIVEIIVALNTVLIGAVGYFLKKWIATNESLTRQALERVHALELAIVREIKELRIALLEQRIKCGETFATKEELEKFQDSGR